MKAASDARASELGGFTQEDVAAIKHAVAHRGLEQGCTEWDTWRRLEELASRIEALLPASAPPKKPPGELE